MCVVSMVTDHYQQRWPMFPASPFQPPASYPPPYIAPPFSISRDEWREYQDLKRKAEEYDRRTGQPDCIKPHLAEWEKAVEELLRQRGLIPAQEVRP